MSTYTPIASVTLSSAQSSVTFSGIPQTYTDLVVVVNGGAVTNNVPGLQLRFNGDTSSLYSSTRLNGNGSLAQSTRDSNSNAIEGGNFSTGFPTFANGGFVWTCNVMNYTNTTTNKTVVARYSAAATDVGAMTGLYRSTSAITSLTVLVTTDNFASGSTFNLYGVANASITNVAKATGGDSVYTDGSYWYHIFRSSGTFTPTQALTADYLVVAGGGAGAKQVGGGGGAGGVRCTVGATGGGGSLESALSLTAQAYTVTIGAGASAGGGALSAGSNSVFGSITATGGGSGNEGGNGQTGGSGSGGSGGTTVTRTGGAGTANQGYAGGTQTRTSGDAQYAAGGGGAGAVGGSVSNPGSSASGNGGNGISTSISGTSTSYGGGGGGGANDDTSRTPGSGGTGGGGTGGSSSTSNQGTAGTANTGGGGGGGGGANTNGAAGGSGIVIVRYAV